MAVTKKKEVDKPKKNVPQNLTPVTIMVVDTISSVRSRRLLKVLLAGSTSTLVNKKYLPKTCRPCQISQSRMVNTFAGSYQSTAMVVMRNSRLPELDKIGILNNKKPSYLSQIPADMM